MVLVGVVALYFLYAGISNLGSAGDVMPARAEQMMNSEIERVGDYLDRMKVAHDTVKEKNAEYIEERQERLDELSKMDTEDYMKEIKKRDRARNWKNIRRGLFWSLMIVLYYFASRPPVFLINKRQRQMAFTSKSANIFKKIIFFLLGVFIAMPSVDRTVVVDSFGSVVGSYDEISPAIAIKIFGILIIIVFVIWLAMILLPVLTIINYLRNYQYEKVDEYFEKAMSTIKGWVGFNK
jgi:ABC-type multidrug transport system fused ATPase/permease subunit